MQLFEVADPDVSLPASQYSLMLDVAVSGSSPAAEAGMLTLLGDDESMS
jgi:hypothetical protein